VEQLIACECVGWSLASQLTPATISKPTSKIGASIDERLKIATYLNQLNYLTNKEQVLGFVVPSATSFNCAKMLGKYYVTEPNSHVLTFLHSILVCTLNTHKIYTFEGYLLLFLQISWGVRLRFFLFFIFLFLFLFFIRERSHFDWLITNFLKHCALPKLEVQRFIWKLALGQSKPLAHLYKECVYIYIWKFNFGQSIWDKNVVLLGKFWGTHQELDKSFGNLMGTHWEQQKKSKKSLFKNQKGKNEHF
jgi:hypothetical protein